MTTVDPGTHTTLATARRTPDGDAASLADPFASAMDALERSGVRWSRLRDQGGGHEDDILVADGDRPAAARALEVAGWREIRHLGHGTHRWFHAYDPDLDRWAQIDVVTGLDYGRWQEWRTGLADGCLARSTLIAGARRMSADDAFWTLLLHETLDRPGTEPRRIAALQELAASARTDGPCVRIMAGVLPRGWDLDRIVARAVAGDAASLRSLGLGMTRRLGRRPFLRARRLIGRTLRWIDHRDPPFLRRGRTVALMGPDGAGKSSLATRIAAGGPLRRQSVYLGLYGGSRAKRADARRSLPGLGLMRRLVAMWRGWLVGWWAVRRGRLVLFDRHPYDARLGDARGWGARLRRAVLGHAVPAPDLVVILDAPAELLMARKPEHAIDRIETQRRRYLALADRLDQAVVVDARAPLDAVARRITALTWHGAAGEVDPR